MGRCHAVWLGHPCALCNVVKGKGGMGAAQMLIWFDKTKMSCVCRAPVFAVIFPHAVHA